MKNVTELKKGSLNGLRRQTNECLVSAYYKGYEDGKKESNEEYGEQEYNRGIENASYLLAYADERFIRECFPSESNWNLFDLNAKYGLAVLIKEFKKWQVEIDQTEEKIKVGDIVRYATDTEKMIVTRVTNEKIETLDKNGCGESWKKTAALHKWGNENVADKLQALFEGSK